jgi:hypothetical protein
LLLICCCWRHQVLSKSYHMLDDDEPVLERSEGTEIDWKPGKNITVKVRVLWTHVRCRLTLYNWLPSIHYPALF